LLGSRSEKRQRGERDESSRAGDQDRGRVAAAFHADGVCLRGGEEVRGVPTGRLVPGAVAGGILYTVLQVLGTYLVHHYLHSDSVYGVFATVLGLIAWIYLATEVTGYCAEINVVLARRLWPRAMVQPPLTEADRASMAVQALQNQRRPEQHIEVTFTDRETDAPARTPQTPDQVAPPAVRP
jgi:hypothetical protein